MTTYRNPATDPRPLDLLRKGLVTRKVIYVTDTYLLYQTLHRYYNREEPSQVRRHTWAAWARDAERLDPGFEQDEPYEIREERNPLLRSPVNTPIPGDILVYEGGRRPQYREVLEVKDGRVRYQKARTLYDLENPLHRSYKWSDHNNWFRWARLSVVLQTGDADDIPEQPLIPPLVGDFLVSDDQIIATVLKVDQDTLTTEGVFDTLTLRQWHDAHNAGARWCREVHAPRPKYD